MNLTWYWQRLRRMSPGEIAGRAVALRVQRRWRRPERRGTAPALTGATAAIRLPPATSEPGLAASAAARDLIAVADRILAGEMTVLGRRITGVGTEPDWFIDPLTGRRSAPTQYCFDVPYRDEARTGNIKFLWEPSRHQATMQLATAWWLTGDTAYAERAASHLRSWWRDNLFLQGVHWVSGIEVGLRLLSWTWIRALLDGWDGCRSLFDENAAFHTQLYDHQRYVAALPSRGSSANNHLIAELAGLATAAVAFPWFAESQGWAEHARSTLAREAVRQTGADGFNREQASDYHLFVFEMLLAAHLAARLAGNPLAGQVDTVLRAMTDALAASLDAAGQPPRYGDGDDGRGLLLDAEPADAAAHVACVVGAAAVVVGAPDWCPQAALQSSVTAGVARLAMGAPAPVRRPPLPHLFADTGQAFIRAHAGTDQVWLRCDHGPLGYLSIAAHGHADALSIELRHGGTEVLTDPGTYCYHGEPAWRRYFKGTAGHNTLTVDGVDQAVNGGPFMWLTRPAAALEEFKAGDDAAPWVWQARHDGYRRLKDPVVHHRRMTLDPTINEVTIEDWIDAAKPHPVLLSFHLGPALKVARDGTTARLGWRDRDAVWQSAVLALPAQLAWTLHQGETEPPLGWYSPGFGHRVPAPTLTGRGVLAPATRLITRMTLPRPPRAALTEETACASANAF